MVRHNLNLNQLDDHRLNKVNIKEEKKEVKIFWVTKGALPLFNIFPPLTPHVMYHKPLDLDTQMLPENGKELILMTFLTLRCFI